jgi:hypothetical protein
MNLIPWMPVIVEVTKFTLEQLGKLVDLTRTQGGVSSSEASKINITLDDLSEAKQSQLVDKIKPDLTPERLRSIQNKYNRAKNVQRQIELKEVAYTGLVDQNSPQALQLQFDIQRLQEDQLFPLVDELNQDLSEIFIKNSK